MKYSLKNIKEAAIKTIKDNPKEAKWLAWAGCTTALLLFNSASLIKLSREVSVLASDLTIANGKIFMLADVVNNHARQIELAHLLEDSNNAALGARIDFLANKLKCLDECNKAGFNAAMTFAKDVNLNEIKLGKASAEGVSTISFTDF